MKAENLTDCVDRLLEMAEFFKGSDPNLALKLRDTASRALDFVAYREYLAQRKRWRDWRREPRIPKRGTQSPASGRSARSRVLEADIEILAQALCENGYDAHQT